MTLIPFPTPESNAPVVTTVVAVPVPEDNAPARISDELADLIAGGVDLARHGKAKSTLRAYETNWQHWLDFCAKHGQTPLPGEPAIVVAFVNQMVKDGYRPSYITRTMSAIGHYHRDAGVDSPTRDVRVKETLTGTRRALGGRVRRAAALGPDQMRRLLAAQDPDDAPGRRNRSLFLFLWYAGARCSEACGLKIEDLEPHPDGLVITLRRSKTDQLAIGRIVFIPRRGGALCPVAALEAWVADLADQRVTDGHLFRGFASKYGPRGWVVLAGGGIRPQSVDRIVRQAVADAALTGGPWTTHSFRAGFATEAAAQGATALEISAQTGHAANSQILGHYVRHGSPSSGNAVVRLSL